jgi:adenine/guanine phosphoribosyltransferase-like PRPP-binding protein
MTGVPSVLTAEAAALALAALISERLGFQQVNFLSDK